MTRLPMMDAWMLYVMKIQSAGSGKSRFAAPAGRALPDRVRQVVLFEVAGIIGITPLFAWVSGEPLWPSAGLLALLSLIAAVWNGVYCTVFDRIENRLTGRRADLRPPRWRLAHAVGMEGGLLLLTLPVVMAWTNLRFFPALLADAGLAATYVVYAWIFHMVYDRAFPIRETRC
jgi:uncharacterized membrane protein